MRVLVVSNFYPPFQVGGAELVAHRHALELRRRGHEVAVFAGRPQRQEQTGGELEFARVDGIEVHVVSLRSLEPENSFYWASAGRRFRAVAIHFRPDVVHFHNLNGLGANLILEAKRLGLRTICTIHDHWGFCARNTLLRPSAEVCRNFEDCHFCLMNVRDDSGINLPTRLRRDFVAACLSQVDQLVFPSQYLAAAYRAAGLADESVVVQSNGIDLQRFTEKHRMSADEVVRFTMIGHLGAHKGIDLLFEALERLVTDSRLRGRWRIAIVGDGAMRGKVVALSADQLFRDHVQYRGAMEPGEIPGLLAQTDVMLLPSLWPENEPVVMIEAIAAGVAQLASRIGGIPELVVDGESGRLFNPDDVDDLVAKMSAYIDDPESARRHGEFNHARREQYDQNRTVSAYESVYAGDTRPRADGRIPVLCHGPMPSLQIAHLFNQFSIFEHNARIRFIFADWADRVLWREARALFVWSDSGGDATLLRAARTGMPVIAPRGSRVAAFLRDEGRVAIEYGTPAEAISAIRSVAEFAETSAKPSEPKIDERADLLGATVKADAFGLLAERPAV